MFSEIFRIPRYGHTSHKIIVNKPKLSSKMASRRKWQPSEEDCFIDIWKQHLYLFESGRKLVEIYVELQAHFREVGIDISAQGIKSKMETFKRKYFNLLHADRSDQSSYWKHFDTMAVIIASTSKEGKDMDWDDISGLHRQQKSIYMNESAEALRDSDGPFNSVFVEECSGHIFKDEEGKRSKKKSADKRKRYCSKYKTPAKPRRCWYPAEEIIFIEVWEQFAPEILSERKKMDVYKDMQKELQVLGLNVTPNDIKSKMESLTRTYRVQRNAVGDKSEWTHYPKLAQLLSPLEPIKFEPFPESSSSSEDDLPWLSEMQPQVEFLDNPTNSSDSVVHQFEDCIQPSPSSPSADTFSIDPDPNQSSYRGERIERVEQTELSRPVEKPAGDRQRAAEEFGQFVTKELAVLNDDLLIEAKRRIYNIICNLQMKQNDLNKLT